MKRPTRETQLVTSESLIRDLLSLGLKRGGILVLHSSLSSLGWVNGGAVALIEALLHVLGPLGTLVMPTHSSALSDPAAWVNPPVPEQWWEEIRRTMPPFTADLTPCRNMGVVPETFRKMNGVIRSSHPTVSFCALGPAANEICGSHPLTPMMGETSPLARIYDLGGQVLLAGVDHNRNTSLHLAEYRAQWEGKSFVEYGSPILRDGNREWAIYRDLDHDDADFLEIGRDFEEACLNESVTVGFLGQAQSRLMEQRDLVDFAVSWMENCRGKRQDGQES